MDNVSRVMEKVEPKQRQEVLEHMVVFIDTKFSSISEREAACIDIYVNCCNSSSWEDIAIKLFRCEQVAAVDEVRSYLPPRGEPCLCSLCIYCTRSELASLAHSFYACMKVCGQNFAIRKDSALPRVHPTESHDLIN